MSTVCLQFYLFSGAPKLVRKCPPGIQEKLDHFGFKRHQVEIITDPSKIRKKRIYTEVEYCHKLGKPPMKKSRVIFIEEPALDVPPVKTIPEPSKSDHSTVSLTSYLTSFTFYR